MKLQSEMPFVAETFNLALQSGEDGERLALERAARLQASEEADRMQMALLAANRLEAVDAVEEKGTK